MKKFLVIWFTILFVVNCSSEKEIKVDPLLNAKVLDKVVISKSVIKDDLNYFLKKHNRQWNKQNKERFIDAIYYGSQEFNINPKIIMSIVSIESQYKITAKGINRKGKKVKSIDFGLSQQNSKYLKHRYKATVPYLKEYKLKHNVKDKYDISCNIFACYMYMRSITDYSDLVLFSDLITAYNQGIRGAKRNNDSSYYEKFLKEFISI
jgi:uncharacterized protein YcfL